MLSFVSVFLIYVICFEVSLAIMKTQMLFRGVPFIISFFHFIIIKRLFA